MGINNIPEIYRKNNGHFDRFSQSDGFLFPPQARKRAIQWAKCNDKQKLCRNHDKDKNNLNRSTGADKQEFVDEDKKNTYSLLSVDNRCIALTDILLGAGSYGYVKLGQDLKTGELVAVKIEFTVISDELYERTKYDSPLQHEQKIYNLRNQLNATLIERDVSDAKIRGKHERRDNGKKRYLIMKFIPGQTLTHFTKEGKHKVLTLDQKKQIAYDLINQLESLHREGIVHADLSANNIMIFESSVGEYKTDFIDLGAAIHRDIDKFAFTVLNELKKIPEGTQEEIQEAVSKQITSLEDDLSMLLTRPLGILLLLLYLIHEDNHAMKNVLKKFNLATDKLKMIYPDDEYNEWIFTIVKQITENNDREKATAFKMLMNAMLRAPYRSKLNNGTTMGDRESLAKIFKTILFRDQNAIWVKQLNAFLIQGQLQQAYGMLQPVSKAVGSKQPCLFSQPPRVKKRRLSSSTEHITDDVDCRGKPE